MATRTKRAAARSRVALAAETVLDGEDGLAAPSYFAAGASKSNLQFFSSGCSVLDECLGGGYVLGRVTNIVGDKSAGKTLLAMEACANLLLKYPDAWIRYAESEAAFDEPYAEALGIPVDGIELNKDGRRLNTIEELYEDMVRCLDAYKGRPGLYIVDSLDAFSDEAELGRDFDEGSYGGTKPKQIGKLFRLLVDRFHEQNVALIIVSQLRDKIGAMAFAEQKTRSGGKALDFYASQILWLAEVGKEKRTIKGVDRVVGVNVRAKVKKNKVGMAHREVDYPVLFGYGIDDMTASVEWLIDVKRLECLDELEVSKSGYKTRINSLRNKGGDEAREFRAKAAAIVRRVWGEIETGFLPKSRKY